MEAGFFIVFIFCIFLAIGISAFASSDQQETNAQKVEIFMAEMREKAAALTVNIQGDLNGTIVLGDISIKNSYNNINKTNKNLAAAITNLGDNVKNVSDSSEQDKGIYPEFKKLVGAFALGQATLIIDTWESFLSLYPNIQKDMIEYMFIDKYIAEIGGLAKHGGDSSGDGGGEGDGGGDGGGGGGDGGGGGGG